MAPASGLVAAYNFDQGSGTTLTDLSGSGNNGTIVNAAWSTSGKYGDALSFNGSSALVNIPNASSLQLTTGMTLEAWVNLTAAPNGWQDVLYKGNDNYWLESSSSPTNAPAAGATVGSNDTAAVGTSALATNTWNFLTETFNGSTLILYVNGTQMTSRALSGSLATSTNQVQIGGDSIYGQYFQGLIDNVRIYNTALTASQIQADMNTPIATGTPPPTTPGNLTATADGTTINLNWGSSSDAIGVSSYVVERENPGSNNFVQIATTTGTTYSDGGLATNSTYSYVVQSVDWAGNQSALSNTASATTQPPDTTPPTTPTNLTATAAGQGQINLSWAASTDNVGVTGYSVWRENPGSSSFVQIGTATGTSYSDTGLSPNSTYNYEVQATDAAGNLSGFSNAASATTLAGIPSLVAAYNFDQGSGTTLTDVSGNGHNGTIVNAAWSTSGKYGDALSFNGSSALVSIPNASSLQLTTGMTLEAWVNPTAAPNGWQDVLYKGNDNYYLESSSYPSNTPVAGATAGSSDKGATATGLLPTNSWSFLTETFNGSTLILYVNGVAIASQALSGSLATSADQLQIGGDSLYGQYFKGLIDNIRIYNTDLTAAEIQDDMNTPIAAGTPPPTAPANLTATANGSTITLNWGASSDAIGVSSYVVERENPGSSSFVQIATTTGTTFIDTNVTYNSTYNYEVQAVDWAGNQSALSNTAGAIARFGISPNTATTFLQPGQTQPFTADATGVIWSVNGVVGGSASTGTITTSGLYTAPATFGAYTVTGTTSNGASSASTSVNVTNYAGTFTNRNDNMRTGANLDETTLTPANVNSTQFGKLFSYSLDGIAFASPLYVPHVNIPGMGYHNVVYVATENDSVYAFDADGLSKAPLWHVSFINPSAGITPIPADETGEPDDIPVEVGITGTPVIDPTTGTIYLVADTKVVANGTTNYYQTLHALDISTGAEKFGGPVVIQASVPGTGSDSSNGMVPFSALNENQHSGLLLSNGVVYFAFSSHGSSGAAPYWHGWVFGYNASTLQQVLVYNDSANGNGSGIWMGADGLATDSSGDIYFTTGNGDFDTTLNSSGMPANGDYGDSVEKLSPSSTVADYFTPFNQATMDAEDLDLASGGLLLLPTQSGSHPDEMILGGKTGTVYVVNRDNMGHFNSSNNNQIIQSLVGIFSGGTPETGNYSSPVYYNGYVYFAAVNDTAKAFKMTNGLLSTAPTSQSAAIYGERGGSMAISANGNTNGILWAVQDTVTYTSPGVLHAYLATNLADELYNSNQAGSRDTLDMAAKFSMPLVANGRVYVGGVTQLTVYGLLPGTQAPAAPTGLTATAGNAQVTLNWSASSGAASYDIYRSTSSGGEGSTPYLTGVTSTSFTDSGLTNGTAYFYEVSAVNANGQSAVSSEVSATPQGTPATPTGLTATAGNAQVTLNWTASSGATSYNIYRATSSGGEGSTPYKTGVTSTSFIDSGLSNGTAYFYEVSAVNANGQSPVSSEVSATPQAPPTAPTNVTATAGNAQVTLGWTASSGATSYDIYRSTSSGGEGSTPYKTGVADTSFIDSSLTNGTTYFYEVSAVNVGGQSLVSSEVSATPQGPPTAPTNVTATAGNAQVTLSWTAPSGATSYNIYRATSSGGEGSTPYKMGVTGTSFIDSSLSNGTTYFYEVSAVNVNGQSPVSSEVSATPQAPPTAPTNVTATAGNAQVTLSWTAPSGATSYNIYRSTSSGGEGSTPYLTGVASTSFIDTGLSNGTTYYYEVSAVNVGGQSPVSSEVSATPQVPAPPAPTNVTATAGNAQVTLNWTASSGATSYDIYRSTTKGGEGSTPYMTGVTTTSFTDTGLTNGTIYYYEVSAVNAGGQSPVSSEVSGTPQAGPAGLVAAYNFDEGTGTTVHDLSGNNNNGTTANTTWSTAGKYGDTLSFNGTSSLVTIPDATSLHLTSGMTLEAWVNPSVVNNNWRDVLYKGNDNFYLEATSNKGSTSTLGGIVNGSYLESYGTSALKASTWAFLTGTYDGTTMRLYVNGTLVSSKAGPSGGSLQTSTNALQIGGDSLYGQYFKGLIDNVRVYNTALSATQIQTDMNTPVTAATPPGTPTGLAAPAGNAAATTTNGSSAGTNASQGSNGTVQSTMLPGASLTQVVQAPILGFLQQQGEVQAEALATGLGLALTNGPRLDSNVTSGLPLGVSASSTYSQPFFLEPLARVRLDDPLPKAADSSQSDSAFLDTLFASPNMLSDGWFGLDLK